MTPPDPDRIRAPLRRLYAELDAAVARLGPVCLLSGRCCRFAEFGHTLFISAPEAALLLADAPPPARPLDQGASCPWQDALGRCTAHDARPLGCRVYYCDASYQDHIHALSETFIARLKRLAEDLDLPWDYAPLHRHLHAARDQDLSAAPGPEPVPSGALWEAISTGGAARPYDDRLRPEDGFPAGRPGLA